MNIKLDKYIAMFCCILCTVSIIISLINGDPWSLINWKLYSLFGWLAASYAYSMWDKAVTP